MIHNLTKYTERRGITYTSQWNNEKRKKEEGKIDKTERKKIEGKNYNSTASENQP